MVSNGCRPGCEEANDKWPRGCQSWVSTTLRNRAAIRLTIGTTSSPRGTASAPPGQKSFCTSTAMRTSLSPNVAVSLALMASISWPRLELRALHAAVHLRGERHQFVGNFDRIGRAGFQLAQRLGQALELALHARPDRIEGFRRLQSSAVLHDAMQQWLSGFVVTFKCQNIVRHAAVGAKAPPHLLAARPGGLVLRALAARDPGVFLQFVNAVDRRHVGRRRHGGTDADAVDRRAGAGERGERILVEAAADKDRHVTLPALIEDVAHALRQGDEIAAVETHGADRDARRLQSLSQRHG